MRAGNMNRNQEERESRERREGAAETMKRKDIDGGVKRGKKCVS
jgi:hypothetical protein